MIKNAVLAVSAPGKRNAEDVKATALDQILSRLCDGNDISNAGLLDRYAAMVSELGLKTHVLEKNL